MIPQTLGLCILLLASSASLSQAQAPQLLNIGTLSGRLDIPGFIVEDVRPQGTRHSSVEQTAQKSFAATLFSNDSTRAAYRINFGEADLNVSPIRLFAEKIAGALGRDLSGKTLRIREFTITANQIAIWHRPTGWVPPGMLWVALAIAHETAKGGGDLLHLDVKIAADLDDLHFEGREYRDLLYKDGDDGGGAAEVVDAAIQNALFNLHRAQVAAEAGRAADAPLRKSGSPAEPEPRTDDPSAAGPG